MRYPRILTCSSARPTYRSCPSTPQHTKSPVRYIRIPGAPAPPKGQATNRDPVNAARRQYPHPTNRPATYNSPTTPAGTARNHPSSTNNAAPDTGEPIAGTPDPTSSGRAIVASTVVSVGPYSFTSVATAAYRSTSSVVQASPPVISVKPCIWSAGRAASVLGVNLAWETFCWAMKSVSSLPGNAWSLVGITAGRSGQQSPPHIPDGHIKDQRSELQNPTRGVMASRSAWLATRSAMPVWVTATPLGVPVVPEV